MSESKNGLDVKLSRWLLGVCTAILVTLISSAPAVVWFAAKLTYSMERLQEDVGDIKQRVAKVIEMDIRAIEERLIKRETLQMLPGTKERLELLEMRLKELEKKQ